MIGNSIWAETKAPKVFSRTFGWSGNAPMGMQTEHPRLEKKSYMAVHSGL
jgi:hypothetical protein